MINQVKKTFALSAVLVSITLLTLSGCKPDQATKVRINRFDIDLFSIHPDSLNNNISVIYQQYPEFLPIFTEHIIRIGKINDPNIDVFLKQFVQDPVIREVSSMTKNLFKDLTIYTNKISKGISEYQSETGQTDNIELIGFISGFNQSFVAMESKLAIGLDNYLGKDCQYYKQLRLPAYIIKKMSSDFIVADAMRAWIQSDLEGKTEAETVLDNIIFEGKILYAACQVLEKNQKSKVFAYSQDQFDWCKDHEKTMWKFMIENKILFSSDVLTIQRLSKEAPFTRDFGADSPPRAGSWVGYRIIEKFMSKNKVSLNELLFKYEASEILAKSAYRP